MVPASSESLGLDTAARFINNFAHRRPWRCRFKLYQAVCLEPEPNSDKRSLIPGAETRSARVCISDSTQGLAWAMNVTDDRGRKISVHAERGFHGVNSRQASRQKFSGAKHSAIRRCVSWPMSVTPPGQDGSFAVTLVNQCWHESDLRLSSSDAHFL